MPFRLPELARKAPGGKARDPLTRYRRYVSLSFVVLGPFFAITAAVGSLSVATAVLSLVAGVPVTAIMLFWERRPPVWLTVTAIVTAMAAWVTVIFSAEPPFVFVLAAMAIAVPLSHVRSNVVLWNLAGAALLVAPVFVEMVVHGGHLRWGYIVSVLIGYAIAWGVFRANMYAWRLYVDLDEARAAEAELAVVRERFRMASDIHDIQGHTLHVIKLKLQLADRLLDRDPEAAHLHLAEARDLVTETLANTRSLVYGERIVTLAGELANAQQLMGAAGITVTVTGACDNDPDEGTAADELRGLLVRETTTNILRHADASDVRVVLHGDTVTITNDGAPGGHARLSGLARLGRRFEDAGGRLTTSAEGGRFRTEGTVS